MKQVFRGKTEEEIEIKLTKWQQENPGVHFKRSLIERLPLQPHRPKFQIRPMEAPDVFSMEIEYEA